MDESASATFGDLLRRYRFAAGLTQEELAERASLGRRSIQGIERGENVPHRDTLRRLIQALALSTEQGSKLTEAARHSPGGRRGLPELEMSRQSSANARPDERRCHNLPIQTTSFVGRKGQLAEVKRLLTETHLLTLTGSGGCGKTRLALQAARELVDTFPEGVWLVDLAPLNDPALVPHAVATVLGFRELPDRPMVTTLLDGLRSRHILLLLDNCEHLIDACAHLVDAILKTCDSVRILATSREMLGVRGEIAWPVPSLALPDVTVGIFLDEVRQNEAIQLFVDRASTVDPGLRLTPENAAVLVRICQRLK